MCPLWPFHYVIVFAVVLVSLFYIATASNVVTCKYWNITLNAEQLIKTQMDQTREVNFNLTLTDCGSGLAVRPYCSDILSCWPSYIRIPDETRHFSSSFNVSPTFIGYGRIELALFNVSTSDSDKNEKTTTESESISQIPVTVVRKSRLIDHVFTASVVILVSVIFINFGCALDIQMVKENFTKPLAPLIGVVCQFLFMPLIGFAIGRIVFADSVPMQLGLFFTGISPSGGASNVWICMLGGNLNLSIAITSISNLCAFLTIPLWTFTLGRVIFDKGSLLVPYEQIAKYAVSLLPPLLIGLILQKKCPKFSRLMVRILKPFSSGLILFIIVFASVTNFYLFKLFTWQILLAGFCLPLFGYILAWWVAVYFGRSYEDRLALSIETGVQNTGIAIFMLRLSLGQPEADLTTVVPVAVALMTPLPIMFLYITSKMMARRRKRIDQVKNTPSSHATNVASAGADSKVVTNNNYPTDDKVSATSLIDGSELCVEVD